MWGHRYNRRAVRCGSPRWHRYWVSVSAVPTWRSQWRRRPADGRRRIRHRSSPISTGRVNSDVPTLGRDGRDEGTDYGEEWLRRQPPNPPYQGRRRGNINRRPNSHQHSRPSTDQLQLHQHGKRSVKDEISVIRRLHICLKSQLKSGATVWRCSVNHCKYSDWRTVL